LAPFCSKTVLYAMFRHFFAPKRFCTQCFGTCLLPNSCVRNVLARFLLPNSCVRNVSALFCSQTVVYAMFRHFFAPKQFSTQCFGTCLLPNSFLRNVSALFCSQTVLYAMFRHFFDPKRFCTQCIAVVLFFTVSLYYRLAVLHWYCTTSSLSYCKENIGKI